MVVNTKMRVWFVTVVIIFILVSSVSSSQRTITHPLKLEHSTSQTPDYWPTEGWQQSTPEEHGMNGTYLEEMLTFCDDRNWPLTSILVIRNGYLVVEEYPDSEYNEGTLFDIWDATKSVTSILIGIAIDEGYISSVDETMVSFFPDRTIANLTSGKEAITLKHLLSMTSGLEWVYGVDWPLIESQSDWIQFTLDKPMVHTPGETWNWNDGTPHLLSAILNSTTGMSPAEFAEIHLFQPLGINNYRWDIDAQGLEIGSWGLNLTASDMAKIGFLYLNNGTWDTEQIVSADWVKNSTQAYSSGISHGTLLNIQHYGYYWWVKPSYNAYCAAGHDGQFIWVLPDYNLVFVHTSGNIRPYDYLITEYILPSLGIFDFTTTTSDTTTATGTGVLDPLIMPIIVGVGVSIAAITIVLVWFMKKRK